MCAATGGPSATSTANRGPALKETILVVDDEPHIRKILKFLLEQNDFQVLTAANGEEALTQARQSLPDLVLLDLMMPKMDGMEVCRRLRADYRTGQIPIIIVTAKGEVSERVRGLKGGANDYLTKPYDHNELIARVRNMLDWSRVQRQANPLTGLPGNQAIEAELQARIERTEPFAFMYIDVDNFKGYNDNYGYSKGDEAIRFVANLLRECSISVGGADSDFIGHIGGDDFVVICPPAHSDVLAQSIVDRFDRESYRLFEQSDIERGYLEVRNRFGGTNVVPFVTLTIAVVVDRGGTFRHWAKVSDVAAELKAYGKSLKGSVVVKERRTHEELKDLPVGSSGSARPA
jgi:diguanylate cyclase (GGDEF)-like protein